MYVTRPLSELLKYPDSLSERPDGPNSGYLVVQDAESETYSFFGLWKNRILKVMPFPQNKELVVQYSTSNGQESHVTQNPVFLIPVLDQPLSSNRYYAIDPHGKHIGEAFTCSKDEDKTTCCFCSCINDVKQRPLDPRNIYQQFEIVPYDTLWATKGYYFAKSTTSDSFPPYFLRQKGWKLVTKTPHTFKLEEARGIDSTLRARLPENFNNSVVIGKWYCPFIFVKDGTLRDQVKRSMYYEMTLEKKWEQIFSCKKNDSDQFVVIDAVVEKEEALIAGYKATWSEKNVVDGVIWFTSKSPGDVQICVGLRVEIVQRMKWEEERVGWFGGEERQVKISKVKEFKESSGWNELKCYILVERFTLKRMDGSLVMTYDFKHCHELKIVWE